MPIGAPIPMPQSGMDSFMLGLQNSQKIFDALVRNRNTNALSAAQEAKNPYVGRQAEADLINQQNINQWYGPKAQSDIGLHSAQASNLLASAADTRQKVDNPGYGQSGIVGEIGFYNLLLRKHPEWAPKIVPILSSLNRQQQAQQTAQPTQAGAQPVNAGMNESPPNPVNTKEGSPSDTANSGMSFDRNGNNIVATDAQVEEIANKAVQNLEKKPISTVTDAGTVPPQNFNQLDALKRHIEAGIKENEEKANYYKRGGAGGRGGVALAQQAKLMENIKRDNPSFDDDKAFEAAGELLDGKTTLADGTPIVASGLTKQNLQNVQGTRATSVIKNQYTQMDLLANDLNDFDINAVASFAGPKGKLKLANAKLQMATNPNDPSIDPMARRYVSAMSSALINMDQMRKAFGTSIVPEYVFKTLGRLSNPADSIWNDEKQVKESYKTVTKAIDKMRNNLREKVKGGVLADPENKSSYTGNDEELERHAAEAIKNGADPQKVREEMARIRGY